LIEVAVENNKPVRIGVNWGSLDQGLLTRLMDANAALPDPKDAREVMHSRRCQRGESVELAERCGSHDQIILSAVSEVQI
jgi:(E)-4-hydroxy-3-methylbut-2-enyl-diphosphate synthase